MKGFFESKLTKKISRQETPNSVGGQKATRLGVVVMVVMMMMMMMMTHRWEHIGEDIWKHHESRHISAHIWRHAYESRHMRVPIWKHTYESTQMRAHIPGSSRKTTIHRTQHRYMHYPHNPYFNVVRGSAERYEQKWLFPESACEGFFVKKQPM